MEWNWLVPIGICATIGIAAMFNTWVRAKHGYPLEDDNGKPVTKLADDRRLELLSAENEKLKGSLLRLEERVAVLEKIATDPGVRVAQEIDALR